MEISLPIIIGAAILFGVLAKLVFGRAGPRDPLMGVPRTERSHERVAERPQRAGGSKDMFAPPPRASDAQLSPELEAEIRFLLAAGKKIHAVKLVRAETGWGLKEAKDAVEAVPDGPVATGAPRTMPARSLPPGTEAEVRMLLADGRKINAIKVTRAATGMGMKEAKDFVEAMERREGL